MSSVSNCQDTLSSNSTLTCIQNNPQILSNGAQQRYQAPSVTLTLPHTLPVANISLQLSSSSQSPLLSKRNSNDLHSNHSQQDILKNSSISNEHHDASTNSSHDFHNHDKMREENQKRRALHKNLKSNEQQYCLQDPQQRDFYLSFGDNYFQNIAQQKQEPTSHLQVVQGLITVNDQDEAYHSSKFNSSENNPQISHTLLKDLYRDIDVPQQASMSQEEDSLFLLKGVRESDLTDLLQDEGARLDNLKKALEEFEIKGDQNSMSFENLQNFYQKLNSLNTICNESKALAADKALQKSVELIFSTDQQPSFGLKQLQANQKENKENIPSIAIDLQQMQKNDTDVQNSIAKTKVQKKIHKQNKKSITKSPLLSNRNQNRPVSPSTFKNKLQPTILSQNQGLRNNQQDIQKIMSTNNKHLNRSSSKERLFKTQGTANTSRIKTSQSVRMLPERSKTPQRSNHVTQILKYQMNQHSKLLNKYKLQGDISPTQQKQRRVDVQDPTKKDRIFNIQIKDKLNQSTLSDINNTCGNGVFSTMQLEKVKGSLVNKNNFIYSNDFYQDESDLSEGTLDQAQSLKTKIDSSINELNALYEGFLKQKEEQEKVVVSQIFDQELAIQDSVRCSSVQQQPQTHDHLSGTEGLQKFAMSIYIMKEMCSRYPWLKAVAKNAIGLK